MASLRCSAFPRLLRRVTAQSMELRTMSAPLIRPSTFGVRNVQSHSDNHSDIPRPSALASNTSEVPAAEINDIKAKLDKGRKISDYEMYRATKMILDSIAEAAAYTISAADRAAGKLEKLPDGEEVGESNGLWHKALGLPPTFSTWSHVTMLQMYVIVARARCLDPDVYKTFYYQLLEHFFFECEAVMDTKHGMGSRSLRHRFLKDLFVQWRGMVAAYDEGLVRGDAVLASAVWRNLYKAREDVDVKTLAAVVSWIRASLWDLERRTDTEIVTGDMLIRIPIQSQMASVDREINELRLSGAQAPRDSRKRTEGKRNQQGGQSVSR